MSRTVSRGLSKVSHWTAVAARVADCLEKKTDIPRGVLLAIERYFQAALVGAQESCQKGIEPMRAISCLTIAINILIARPNSQRLTLKVLRGKIHKYSKSVSILKEKGPIGLKPLARAELRDFLVEMARQGNLEQELNVFTGTM